MSSHDTITHSTQAFRSLVSMWAPGQLLQRATVSPDALVCLHCSKPVGGEDRRPFLLDLYTTDEGKVDIVPVSAARDLQIQLPTRKVCVVHHDCIPAMNLTVQASWKQYIDGPAAQQDLPPWVTEWLAWNVRWGHSQMSMRLTSAHLAHTWQLVLAVPRDLARTLLVMPLPPDDILPPAWLHACWTRTTHFTCKPTGTLISFLQDANAALTKLAAEQLLLRLDVIALISDPPTTQAASSSSTSLADKFQIKAAPAEQPLVTLVVRIHPHKTVVQQVRTSLYTPPPTIQQLLLDTNACQGQPGSPACAASETARPIPPLFPRLHQECRSITQRMVAILRKCGGSPDAHAQIPDDIVWRPASTLRLQCTDDANLTTLTFTHNLASPADTGVFYLWVEDPNAPLWVVRGEKAEIPLTFDSVDDATTFCTAHGLTHDPALREVIPLTEHADA